LRLLVSALILLAALPAQAENRRGFDVHKAVLAEAFDPERFFDGRYVDAPVLTIRYLGDDYDYPVYAIALFKGCHDADAEGDRSCRERLQVRMIRAPYDGEPERPRWRGTRLLEELRSRGVSSRKELLQALDDGAVEWLEADLAACPAALEHARSTGDLRWFSEPLVQEPSDNIAIVLHADTVDVRFRPNYFTDFRYTGIVDDDLPNGWANAFAKSLETCWRPATAIRPWRRTPARNTDDR
jgi:hypothetical protein